MVAKWLYSQPIFWWLELHLNLRRRGTDVLIKLATWVPRPIRRWVIVNAAVRSTWPAMNSGGYCGPDGITYKDMYDNA